MPKITPTVLPVHRSLVQAFKARNESPEKLADYISRTFDTDISSRTIRNYFSKLEGSAGMSDKNTDILCEALLSVSYKEAISKFTIDLFDSKLLSRYHRHIEMMCGNIQVLDMDWPIQLDDVYTEAFFLESPKSRVERKFVHTLSQNINEEPYSEQLIPATQVIEKHKRLMVLGPPGTGKSTLLRYLALYHLQHPIQEQKYFPIYLALRAVRYTKWDCLLDKVIAEVETYIPNARNKLTQLFEEGRILLLLDGLDEVDEPTFDFVCRGLNELAYRYPDNRYIATCRTKSFSEYKFVSFSDFELSGFTNKQRDSLIEKWFAARESRKNENELSDSEEEEWLQEAKYQFISELQQNKPIQRLASNPLTLTFLLYTFEYNNGRLARRRLTLLQSIVDIFVSEWDRKRRIRRRDLAPVDILERKTLIDLFSYIAYKGFISPSFKTEWSLFELEDLISPFLERIDIKVDPRDVITAIEATSGILAESSKGIYSFQPLTFQEYFTALYIIENQTSEHSLEKIVGSYFTNIHWQEVFPLATDRLSNSDEFLKLMFQYVSDIPSKNRKLQDLISWVNETTESLLGDSASSSWSSLLLTLDLEIGLYTQRIKRNATISRIPFHELSIGLAHYNQHRGRDTHNQPKNSIALWLAIIYALTDDVIKRKSSEDSEEVLPLQEVPMYVRSILEVSESTTIQGELESVIDEANDVGYSSILKTLEELQETQPSEEDSEIEWIKWRNSLRKLMTEEFNIGYNIVFSDDDYLLLEQYIYGNNLLLRCIRESISSTVILRTD